MTNSIFTYHRLLTGFRSTDSGLCDPAMLATAAHSGAVVLIVTVFVGVLIVGRPR